MASEPRLSAQTLKVLGAFLSSSTCELSGAQLGATSKLASGTLYPMLIRLEAAGWLSSRWENDDPHVLQRPRRRYYRLTADGVRKSHAAFAEIQSTVGGFRWA
ncbi:PadR family transcriptional regulator [Methylobacterium sp. J-048]|uniref:PadR family transcriptional regulator n=1 Tax=Methylobacterium sp. J-048 TaxID=2836635 RepID=UPI00391A9425